MSTLIVQPQRYLTAFFFLGTADSEEFWSPHSLRDIGHNQKRGDEKLLVTSATEGYGSLSVARAMT